MIMEINKDHGNEVEPWYINSNLICVFCILNSNYM
jgi:hypothetical protein